jgi:hypothetical protein
MAQQDIAHLHGNGLQRSLARFDRPERISPRHAVGAGRNLDRAVLPRNRGQAKTDDDRIGRERQVRVLGKERALIVHVQLLVLRSRKRHIASPLIDNDPPVHKAADDFQHIRIEEELGRKARGIEWHREKITMRPSIRLRGALEMCEQAWPEGLPALFNEVRSEVLPQDAVALVLELNDRFLN